MAWVFDAVVMFIPRYHAYFEQHLKYEYGLSHKILSIGHEKYRVYQVYLPILRLQPFLSLSLVWNKIKQLICILALV